MAMTMKIDRNSETWLAIQAWAETRLKDHAVTLKQFELPVLQTEGHRYAIAELEALLNFGEPSKIPPQMYSEA